METVKRKCVLCPNVAKPAGPYSHAEVIGTTAYIAGLIGNEVSSADLVSPDSAPQAEQALKNLGEVLKHIGVTFNNDFPSHYPARTAFGVSSLPRNARVMVEAVADLRTIEDDV